MTLDETITALLKLGFLSAGATAEQVVRIPTIRAPVYGGLGGERRTIAGRDRYVLPGTDLRATVGPRTTNLYFSRGGKTAFVLNEHTRDLTHEQLRKAVVAATGAVVNATKTPLNPEGLPRFLTLEEFNTILPDSPLELLHGQEWRPAKVLGHGSGNTRLHVGLLAEGQIVGYLLSWAEVQSSVRLPASTSCEAPLASFGQAPNSWSC